MASMPQFYCDYPNSGGETSTYGGAISSGDGILIATSNSGAIWGGTSTATVQESFHLSNFDSNVLQPDSAVMSPPPVMSSFPEQVGMLDSVGLTMPDYSMAFCAGVSGMQNFGGVCCEFGDHEYCCGFVQDLKPVFPSAADNWGIQNNGMPSMEDTNTKVGRYSVEERKDRILRYLKKKNRRNFNKTIKGIQNNGMPSMEDTNTKVGRYSVEERKDRILRYLKKKNRRNFNKTIKYECRKTLADRRVRVRGRFVRNSELCEEETVMKNNNGNPQKEKELYCSGDVLQMKQDEEWLQEAMASLM